MNNYMIFPDTVEEYMEQNKVVDTEQIYSNGMEFVPIFRMKQWFEHLPSAEKTGKWIGDKCSVCGEERAWYGCNPSYCPDCGCRMEREEG